MCEQVIKEGMRIKEHTGEEFRVLSIFGENIICCRVGIPGLEFICFDTYSVRQRMRNDELEVIVESPRILDTQSLSEKDINLFEAYKEMCDRVFYEYKYRLPELVTRKQKPIVKQLCTEFNVNRQVFWKVFTRYLQSGFSDYALVDQRTQRETFEYDHSIQRGRKPQYGTRAKLLDERDIRNFEKYRKKYMTSEVKTIENAYLDMIEFEYSIKIRSEDDEGRTVIRWVKLPKDQRPTKNQFYYYLRTHTTERQRDEAKKTAKVVRNNERVYRSTVMDGVRGPGHVVECDAQEMDIALVSQEYPDKPVGRPILYVMIDVMSHIILGVSLAMDNNSVVGLTNCFLNLVEDKESLIRKYTNTEITFEGDMGIDDLWPTGYKPSILRYDRGSDFISNSMERILRELNIRSDYVPGATGSMKPLVENFFGGIKKDLDDLLENRGLIRNTYGSKHHEQSCLDYQDAFGLVINHVLAHNNQVITTYPKSAEMKRQKLMATPVNLWRFGCDTMRQPQRFLSQDDVIYHVLEPCKDATVSKTGIRRRGMPYFNAQDTKLQERMYALGTKRVPFECRTDPRDIGHIYYLKDGALLSAALPSEDYRFASYYNMSQKRFDELEHMNKEIAAAETEHNLQVRIDKRRRNREITAAAAQRNPGKKDTSGLRENRREVKELISGQNSVAERFAQERKYAKEAIIGQQKDQEGPAINPNESLANHSSPIDSLPHYEDGDSAEDLHRKMMEMSMDMEEY